MPVKLVKLFQHAKGYQPEAEEQISEFEQKVNEWIAQNKDKQIIDLQFHPSGPSDNAWILAVVTYQKQE